MKSTLFLFSLLLTIGNVFGQELVPNPGFETYTECPTTFGEVDRPPYNGSVRKTVTDWVSPTNTNPDYFNSCSTEPNVGVPDNALGHHPSYKGTAYVGIMVWSEYQNNPQPFSEYVICKLNRKLERGIVYDISFYVKSVERILSGDSKKMAVKSIGVLFTDTAIQTISTNEIRAYGVSMVNETETYLDNTDDWQEIKGVYKADGTETYMTIGGLYGGNRPDWAIISGSAQSSISESFYLLDEVDIVGRERCDTFFSKTVVSKCESDFPLGISVANDSATYFSWNTGATTKVNFVPHTGVYIAVSGNGCHIHTDTFEVGIRERNIVKTSTALIDTEVCETVPVPLYISTEEPASYLWNTDDTTCCISVNKEGVYTVSAYNSCDTVTEDVVIKTKDCYNCLFIPSAFSPNADGLNDFFGAATRCGIMSFQIRVYNRWGQEVFASDDIRQRWNGMYKADLAEQGTYYYMAEYVTEYYPEIRQEKGSFVLLR